MNALHTTIGENIPVTVEFDFSPEQEQILHPDEKAQPGYAASAEITSVIFAEKELLDVLRRGVIDRLELECIDEMEVEA